MWPFGIGNKYPYTDFHELNTDYLIEKTGKIDQNLKDSETAREGAEAAQAAAETAQAAAETAQAAAETAQEGAETAEENTEEYYNNLQTHIADDVTGWLEDNVTPVGSAVVVDSSLTISGAAADAKETGKIRDKLNLDIEERSYYENKQIIEIVVPLVRGTIGYESGTNEMRYLASDTRLRTDDFIDLSPFMKQFIKIEVPTGYSYATHSFTAPNKDSYYSPIAREFVTTTDFGVNEPYYQLVLQKGDGTQTVDDGLYVKFYIDNPDKKDSIYGNYFKEIYSDYNIITQQNGWYTRSTSSTSPTNLIEIPKHNPFNNYAYDSFKYVNIGCDNGNTFGSTFIGVAFFDENYNLLNYETTAPILTNKQAKYLVALFNDNYSKFYVGFGASPELPTYCEYKPEINANYLPSIGNTIHNTDGAKTNLLRVALKYAYNDEFGYGNTHTAFSADASRVPSDGVTGGTSDPVYEGLKYQIDCSAFNKLCIQNIIPEDSKYYAGNNYPARTGHHFNNKAEYDNEYKRLTANKLAKYASDNGYLYVVENDLSNVEVGDFVFLCNQSPTYNFFKNIGHTGLVSNVWDVKQAPYRFRAFEAHSDTTYPIQDNLYTKDTNRQLIYGARFPLPDVEINTTNLVDNFSGYEGTITLEENGEDSVCRIYMTESFRKCDCYTIVLDADIPDGSYFKIYIGNTAYLIGAYGENVRNSNSGIYVIHGVTYNNMDNISGNNNFIVVSLKTTNALTDAPVNIKRAKIINAYCSNSVDF